MGTTATATLTISNGSVNGFTITNPGLGYSQTNPPQVIVSAPNIKNSEIITGISSIQGNTGIITGIQATTIGSDKAIKFTLTLDPNENEFSTKVFKIGNPIFIYETEVGDGVISINGSDSETVGIGTTCVDNIYIIKQISITGSRPNPVIGVITCRVNSTTNMANIPTTVGYSTDPIGKFSVGIFSWSLTSLEILNQYLSVLQDLQLTLDYLHSQRFKDLVVLKLWTIPVQLIK